MSVKAGIDGGRLYGLTCAHCIEENKTGPREVFSDTRTLRNHTRQCHGAQKPKRGPLALAATVWLCHACRRVFFNEIGIATHQGRSAKCRGSGRGLLVNENLSSVHFDASEPDETPATATTADEPSKKAPARKRRPAMAGFESVEVVAPTPPPPVAVQHKAVSEKEVQEVFEDDQFPWPRVADPPTKKARKSSASTPRTVEHTGGSDTNIKSIGAMIDEMRTQMFQITRDSVSADRWTRQMVMDELDQRIKK